MRLQKNKTYPILMPTLGKVFEVLAAAVVFATTAGSSQADVHKDPKSGCVVFAPRALNNDNGGYTFAYQGGCKDALAQGQGKATWTLSAAPQHPVVWQGRFSHGVYLPPSRPIEWAQGWKDPHRTSGYGDTVLFDLGGLPSQTGAPHVRVQVLAKSDMKEFPDPCKPDSLWLVNVPQQVLTQDDQAKSLLLAGVAQLKVACKAASFDHGVTNTRVNAVTTAQLQSDQWGNPGPAIASSFVMLGGASQLQGYTNQAAQGQRQLQQLAQDKNQRQANLERLRTFFHTYSAWGWASLDDIATNPFRYQDKVVVTSATVTVVINPTRAVLDSIPLPNSWGGTSAIVEGNGIGQWKPGPRIFAVKVLGRKNKNGCKDEDDTYCGLAQLELVGSQSCNDARCEDWLVLPTKMTEGFKP